MKTILVIEDDKNKIERLKKLLFEYTVIFKESFHSGVSELKDNHSLYDLLILDMTIPLWEKGNNDLGGNVEQFGGERILREMKRRNLNVPTVLFTMFDVFPVKHGVISFEEINKKFLHDFSPFYVGGIYFDSIEDNWQIDMLNFINK